MRLNSSQLRVLGRWRPWGPGVRINHPSAIYLWWLILRLRLMPYAGDVLKEDYDQATPEGRRREKAKLVKAPRIDSGPGTGTKLMMGNIRSTYIGVMYALSLVGSAYMNSLVTMSLGRTSASSASVVEVSRRA